MKTNFSLLFYLKKSKNHQNSPVAIYMGFLSMVKDPKLQQVDPVNQIMDCCHRSDKEGKEGFKVPVRLTYQDYIWRAMKR